MEYGNKKETLVSVGYEREEAYGTKKGTVNKEINPKIVELAKHDVTVHNGLMMVEKGVMTYTQALEQMVIALSEANKKQHENLVKMINQHGSSALK